MLSNTTCRVCGFDGRAPVRDQYGCGTFEICVCCGAEAGYEDLCREAILSYRQNWLAGGAKWFRPKQQPPDWVASVQLIKVFGGLFEIDDEEK